MDSYQLDKTDIKILNLLQQDGLMTYTRLARETHKTHNPILERVNRLKNLGFIQHTVAIVDVKKIRSIFISFTMIRLENHYEETVLKFKALVNKLPETMECHHVMGQYDFLLKIAVPDVNAYNEFLRKNISPLAYVLRVESFPMLAEIKRETRYQL